LSLERVEVLKRDGALIAEPTTSPTDKAGLNVWQKLTLYARANAQHANRPLHVELIRRLRLEGAASGVVFPGVWGYSGDHEPRGDRFMSVRRRVPVVTSIIDQPDAIQRWWRIVDKLTDREGLVTSELVPALRATGPDLAAGGLRLAET
jgi:PII-like signaling protein